MRPLIPRLSPAAGLLAIIFAAQLVAAAPARAHNLGPQFITVFDQTSPNSPGIFISVLSTGKAPQFIIAVPGGHELAIKGPHGEVLARLTHTRVQVNKRSSSKYLLDDPKSWPAKPPVSTPPGPPSWEDAGKPPLKYFEPRAEWPLTGPPDAIRKAGRRATIYDWRIPALYDGKPIALTGHVDWNPRPIWPFALVAAAFVLFLVWFARGRG